MGSYPAWPAVIQNLKSLLWCSCGGWGSRSSRRSCSLGGTDWAVWILLDVLIDGRYDLAIIFDVFPIGDLAAVNDHLIIGRMQLSTTQFSQLGTAALTFAWCQVVDILEDQIFVVNHFEVAKVG